MMQASAYVIRVFRNGLAVFVNQFGLEGLITFKDEVEFDQDNYEVTIPKSVSGLKKDLKLGIFDQCKVEIGVTKDAATKRGKVSMHLVG